MATLFSTYLAEGSTDFYRRVIPETIVSLRVHFMTATPNSVYCFNKRGFLIFFVDVYFMCYYFRFIHGRAGLTYPYLVIKAASIVVPFLLLSPVDRLPF